MQLLAKKGFEGGEIKGLGLINGEVKKLNFDKKNKFKVPHVGFNKVVFPKKNLLYRNLEKKNFFYFTHSYILRCNKNLKNFIFAYCNHGSKFIASFESKNIFGTQFHPEKSDKIGLKIIDNFINL